MDYKISELFSNMRPHILDLISGVGGGSGPFAPTPHDLQSGHHTGSLADSQAPQFLKTDGSRSLLGNLAVADGVTLDGVDLSVFHGAFDTHRLATAQAAHNGLGQHTHTSIAEGGQLDHGLALTGLLDDDHTNYLNVLRHDVLERHTLGTVVPHDDHGNLSSLGADHHLQYFRVDGARGMSGHIIPTQTDTYDIGTDVLMFRSAYISEITAVIFAEMTAALVGGWLIIPHDQCSLPSDVGSADLEIDFGKAMTPGDFLVLRRPLVVEYMQVGALVSGTTYAVTRALDGTSANDWPGGTAVHVLGQLGDGRIELDAYGEPRISVIVQGAAYNQQTEWVRAGSLDGWQAAGLTGYGQAMGNFAASEYMYYSSATNRLVVRGTVEADDGYLANLNVSGLLSLQTTGELRAGTTTNGIRFGYLTSGYFLRGVGGGVTQVEIRASDGKLTAGAGAVYVDADGVTIVGATTPNPAKNMRLSWFEDAARTIDIASIVPRTINPGIPQLGFYIGGSWMMGLSSLGLTVGTLSVTTITKPSTGDTGYVYVPLPFPLTSAAWDGDARSTTARTLIDLSAVFGVPAGVKAVVVRMTIRDSGSAGNDCQLSLSPNSGSGPIVYALRCSGLPNDMYSSGQGIVPCDANGDIYYQIAASGAGTMDATLEIVGYFL